MKFIIDNNLSRGLARGLNSFGEDVEHVIDYLPEDTSDVDLLQFVGSHNFCLITRDNRIRYKKAEFEALKKYNVGAFFLLGKNMGRWAIVKQMIRNWENIKDHAENQKPFAYKVPSRGKKLTKHSLD